MGISLNRYRRCSTRVLFFLLYDPQRFLRFFIWVWIKYAKTWRTKPCVSFRICTYFFGTDTMFTYIINGFNSMRHRYDAANLEFYCGNYWAERKKWNDSLLYIHIPTLLSLYYSTSPSVPFHLKQIINTHYNHTSTSFLFPWCINSRSDIVRSISVFIISLQGLFFSLL